MNGNISWTIEEKIKEDQRDAYKALMKELVEEIQK